MKNSCSLSTLWTKVQLVKMQTVFSGQHKRASCFVWGNRETITGGDGGEIHLVEKMCLWRWTCLPQPCVRSRLRDRSQEAGPTSHIHTENSASPFSVLVQHQRRPPISQIADFAIRVPWEARTWFWVGKEKWTWQRDCAKLPKVQTFCMYKYLSNDCWQSAQELLLDVGAELILKPAKPEGVSVRLVTTAEKNCTLTGEANSDGVSRSIKELINYRLIKPLLAKRNFHGTLFTAFSIHFFSWPPCIVFLSCWLLAFFVPPADFYSPYFPKLQPVFILWLKQCIII